jgi:ABC-type transport system involved in multi-copper enzyme maturation permease subunit
MRPYLAIIKDSFREALASRVLWILLVLITLVLLLLAPLGYREEITVGLKDNAFREFPEFIERLREDGVRPEPSPARRIWRLLDESSQKKVEDFALPEEGDAAGAFEFIEDMEEIIEALDKVSRRADFYDEESFEKTRLISSEAQELEKRLDELSEEERLRFNRLLLESAFPDQIRTSPRTSLAITYLIWEPVGPMPVDTRGFTDQVEGFMSGIMKVLVGWVGIFVAILVTASIIPHTFEPGSINLLLSKPVSRWLLFLSKYLGGCAFVLINAAYLIGGIWLILGVRFGIWDPSLLLAIPVYLFMFAIYYAVSALAGLIWRSTVVSIVVTLLFVVVCILVGACKGVVENLFLPKQTVKVVQAGDTLISVNEVGLPSRWDESSQEWTDAFLTEDQQQMRPMLAFMPPGALPPVVGPVYDEQKDQLLAIHRSLRTRNLALTVGRGEDEWETKAGADAPPGTFTMFREPDGKVLVVSSVGIFRLVGDPLASPDPVSILGMDIPFTGASPFRSVGPDPAIILTPPAAAAMNGDTGVLAVYSRGNLSLLAKTERGDYELRSERKLGEDSGLAVTLACGGSTLVVARRDGTILVLDGDSLEERTRFQPEERSPPRVAAAAAGGRWFSIVFHDGRLLMLDSENDTLSPADVKGQGAISIATFVSENQLLVADRRTRVTRYDVTTGEVLARYAPSLGIMERAYYYVIVPVYTVFPKPSELDTTISYLLSGEETKPRGPSSGDLEVTREQVHPWAPVWSSLAFTVVLLILACVYIERQEF